MGRIRDAAKWLTEKDPVTDDPLKTQRVAFNSGGLQQFAVEYGLTNFRKIGYETIYNSSVDYVPLLCNTVDLGKKKKKLRDNLIQEVLGRIPSTNDGYSYCFFVIIATDYYFAEKNVMIEQNNNLLIQTFFSYPPDEISREYSKENCFDSSNDFRMAIREEIEDLISSTKPAKSHLYQPIFQIFILKSKFQHSHVEQEGNVYRPNFRKKR